MKLFSKADHSKIPVDMTGKLGRQLLDRWSGRVFLLFSAFPAVLIIIILATLLTRSLPILQRGPFLDFLQGIVWHPAKGYFGYFPFIAGTWWVTLLAMVIAIPPGLLSAIYLSEYAFPLARTIFKPLLDILAGIPSVVYGVWGVTVIVPWIRNFAGPLLNSTLGSFLPMFVMDNPTGYSVLAGSIVLAIMVIPVIVSISYEVLESVPDGLREASLAMGATRLQTLRFAVIRKAAPGIVAACMMAFSRAFGETMAVLMVVGNVPEVPKSILDPAYPLTALIANNYGEMLSVPLYDSALMNAALILLVIILIVNLIAAVALNRTLKRLAQ